MDGAGDPSDDCNSPRNFILFYVFKIPNPFGFSFVPQVRREAVVLSLRQQIKGILIELEENPDDGMEMETTVDCGLTNDDLQQIKYFTEQVTSCCCFFARWE